MLVVCSQARRRLLEHHHLARKDFKDSHIKNSSLSLFSRPVPQWVLRSTPSMTLLSGRIRERSFNRWTLKGRLDNTRTRNQEQRREENPSDFQITFLQVRSSGESPSLDRVGKITRRLQEVQNCPGGTSTRASIRTPLMHYSDTVHHLPISFFCATISKWTCLQRQT
jgi:hypothetical protein